MRCWRLAMVATAMLMAACVSASSGGSATVVFEEVRHEVVACPGEVPDGTDCLAVTATVVGAGEGSGSCVVHAAGEGRTIEASAASPTWELRPGATIQWQVQVDRPVAADFHGWNPYCEPMIEG